MQRIVLVCLPSSSDAHRVWQSAVVKEKCWIPSDCGTSASALNFLRLAEFLFSQARSWWDTSSTYHLCLTSSPTTNLSFPRSSLYWDFLPVTYRPLLCLFCFWLTTPIFPLPLPSVSFVITTVPQSNDTLQTFRPNGRQLIVCIEAKL